MHIQDPSQAKQLVPHWGYAYRVLPCVNDPGTCEYLDAVYRSHDLSMIYSFALWAIIACVLVIWVIVRLFHRLGQNQWQPGTEVEKQRKSSSTTICRRIFQTTYTFLRRHLYPEFPGSTFGNVSRLQVLVFVIISTYVFLFSLVGITYKTWITPNKHHPDLFDTRTGFAGFANRVGVFAFALTPLTIFLSTRESILTLLTGISYQHFTFLHRWTGRLIFIQGCMHTFGWMVIEGCLYSPQPTTYKDFMVQPYILWGSAAIFFLVFLYVFSIKGVIEYTGYEFFLISHLGAAVMFIATCWNHWPKLECWMIASLTILLLDFTMRTFHFFLIHFKISKKFKFFIPAHTKLSFFDDPNGKVVRLDFKHPHKPWKAGQHYMLTFPAISIWQSHPFTVLSSPDPHKSVQEHSYIIRTRTGETAKLGMLSKTTRYTNVLLSGPYGPRSLWSRASNILAISGGTGISFTLPVIREAASSSKKQFLQLIWIIRRLPNIDWIKPELEVLKANPHIHIRILVTGGGKEFDSNVDNVSSDKDEKKLAQEDLKDTESPDSISFNKRFEILHLNRRPIMEDLITEYLDQVESDRILVIGSGPPQMGVDARRATAIFNCPKQVWRGVAKGDVDFYWDY